MGKDLEEAQGQQPWQQAETREQITRRVRAEEAAAYSSYVQRSDAWRAIGNSASSASLMPCEAADIQGVYIWRLPTSPINHLMPFPSV